MQSMIPQDVIAIVIFHVADIYALMYQNEVQCVIYGSKVNKHLIFS